MRAQAILDACRAGKLPADVVAVISNNPDSGALRRARGAGIPTWHQSSRTHEDPEALDAAIAGALHDSGADVVVLAGYAKKLGALTLARFRGRILNTHPALLPKFGGQGMYGLSVHRAVIAAGEAGNTPESLARRVQERERAFVVEVLADIAPGIAPRP